MKKICKVLAVSSDKTVVLRRASNISGEWIDSGLSFTLQEVPDFELQWFAERLGKFVEVVSTYRDAVE